jgi:dipeptidyl aminopeptidase/acylaminoacyl peptidase
MKKLMLASLAALALAQAPAAFARPMTATDLATLRRMGAPAVSPDGNWAVYQLRETDLAANRGRTDLFLLDLRRADAQPVKIASAPDHNEHDARFSAAVTGFTISPTPRARTRSGGCRCPPARPRR